METKGLAKSNTGTVQAIALGKGSGQTANGEVDVNGYSSIHFHADTTITLKFADGTADISLAVKEGERWGIGSDVSKISFAGQYSIC
jgi:hypothetical protein